MKTRVKLIAILFLGICTLGVYAQETGTFTDPRDGKEYQTVKIAKKVWMAENLAYEPPSGNYWAYNNLPAKVATYGYLYDWETAKKVCPDGWHLPKANTFKNLYYRFAKGLDEGIQRRNAYQALKFRGSTGFSALLGGTSIYFKAGREFHGMGESTRFWSSSKNGKSEAYILNFTTDKAYLYAAKRSDGLYVRCIKD